MKKWLLIIGAALAVVFVAVLSAWLWLMHTESGARWALARADGALDRVEYRALSGSLSSDLRIEGFGLQQGGTRVTAEQLELALRVELFNGPRILIRSLDGQVIDVHLPSGEPPAEETAPADPFDLGSLALPVQIDVERLDLQSVHPASALSGTNCYTDRELCRNQGGELRIGNQLSSLSISHSTY